MTTLLERRTVSRKTPRDGKLEITKGSAAALLPLGAALRVAWQGSQAPGTVDTMRCTCRGADNPHEHYFVQSELFKALEPAAEVELRLDAGDELLTVTPAS
jgi:hypothetical protein